MPFIKVGGHRRGTAVICAEVDEEDFERVNKYKWGKNTSSSANTIYAQTGCGKTKKHLHRVIMGLGDYKDDKRIINHIDGDGLNNKKSNLEICDNLYNSQSFRRVHQNVGSVHIDKSGKRIKKWRACIIIDKVRHQQRFETEQEGKDFIATCVSNASHQSSQPVLP
jgi:hypothetical protein